MELTSQVARFIFIYENIRIDISNAIKIADNRHKIEFIFSIDGNKEFESFITVPCHFSGIEQISIILNYVSLPLDATDEEFFQHHTTNHLNWLKSSTAQELQCISSDIEQNKSQYLDYINAVPLIKEYTTIV